MGVGGWVVGFLEMGNESIEGERRNSGVSFSRKSLPLIFHPLTHSALNHPALGCENEIDTIAISPFQGMKCTSPVLRVYK